MKRLINVKELAEYLGISPNTIRSWVWLRKINFVKCGRLVKFDIRDVNKWIKEHRRFEGEI